MQVKHTLTKPTEAELTVSAGFDELESIKLAVVTKLSKNLKVPGFRAGKVPPEIAEKSLDQALLQSEFLEEAVNQLYPSAVRNEKLRPVERPEITIKKFVPYTTLEFEAKLAVIGPVKLADYKKIKLTRSKVEVKTEDVNEVIESLRTRSAEKKDVTRAAKDGDQVWIDFKGFDQKGESIKGADGDNYPLVLGSNTFIPGFEPELVGKGANDETEFTLTFPKDYGVKPMANKKVTFKVKVLKVQEVVKPKVDNDFASKVGPFKSVKELKDDIKKQLEVERSTQVERDFESELVQKISEKSSVEIPDVLINEQVEQMVRDLQSNFMYRGQTSQEFFEGENTTEDKYREEVLKPQAQERVKAGIILTEISEAESLTVTNDEVQARLMELRAQYKDQKMQEELNKSETANEIASRILTEKTVDVLKKYATK